VNNDIIYSRSRRVALCAAALMVAAAPASAQQPAEIKVGLAALVNTALPLHLAEAGGFYAKQGLKVTIVVPVTGREVAVRLRAASCK
jgi:ABC-type nitrate/sulfonate/bicarbonate transport system substrate-binding protein